MACASPSASAPRNHNPVISGLVVEGAALPHGATLLLQAGQEVSVGAAPADSRERYTLLSCRKATRRAPSAWWCRGTRPTAASPWPAPTSTRATAPSTSRPARRRWTTRCPRSARARCGRCCATTAAARHLAAVPVLHLRRRAALAHRAHRPAARQHGRDAVVVSGDAMQRGADVLRRRALPNGSSYSPGRQAFRGYRRRCRRARTR